MLLTELILSKRGPLAKVWLSAHHERKLNKQQALSVDVEESVDAILTQDEGPTTLRISGQLMLGVTRIYSRKVQYLLDDCKETKDHISLAFRPGVVDLPEDQAKASKNAITFSDARNDFDFYDWTWTAPPPAETRSSQTAITTAALRPTTKEFGAYNFGRPAAPSLYGGSTSRHASHDAESSSHLDSQDFSGIDLDLRLEDFAPGGPSGGGIGDDSMSIEAGRHVSRDRGGSLRSSLGVGREGSLGMGGGMDEHFGQVDLNLDFDFDAGVPGLEAERRVREGTTASSALSTPPPVSPNEFTITDITPRTAARIAQYPEQQKEKRPRKLRMTRADAQLELDDSYFTAPQADSAIIRSDVHVPNMGLTSDELDFLPMIKVGNETMLYAGPAGLSDELKELFTFPANLLRRDRGQAGMADEEEAARQAKRPRLNEDDDDAVEAARRQSTLPPDFNLDFGGGGMDESYALPDITNDAAYDIDIQSELVTPRKSRPVAESIRAPSLAPSRAESAARQIQYGEDSADYTLAMFDSRTAAGASESHSQSLGGASLLSTPSKSAVAAAEQRTRGGYSKNTGMAMGLLRRELEAIEEEDKKVSFEGLADKASKRAAASFFFELLVLGTRDCVKLEQKKAFGDVDIAGKDKLWNEITA